MDNNWINLHIISIRSSSLFLFSPSGWLGRGRKVVNELIWLILKSICYFINEKSSSAAILGIIIFGMRRTQQLAKSQKLRMIVLLQLPYLFVDRIQLCPPNTALIPFECLNWKEQLWGEAGDYRDEEPAVKDSTEYSAVQKWLLSPKDE